jgi:hypothetical protein
MGIDMGTLFGALPSATSAMTGVVGGKMPNIAAMAALLADYDATHGGSETPEAVALAMSIAEDTVMLVRAIGPACVAL